MLIACGILVPWPGVEPVPPKVEAQRLNHWTAKEVPKYLYFWNRFKKKIKGQRFPCVIICNNNPVPSLQYVLSWFDAQNRAVWHHIWHKCCSWHPPLQLPPTVYPCPPTPSPSPPPLCHTTVMAITNHLANGFPGVTEPACGLRIPWNPESQVTTYTINCYKEGHLSKFQDWPNINSISSQCRQFSSQSS